MKESFLKTVSTESRNFFNALFGSLLETGKQFLELRAIPQAGGAVKSRFCKSVDEFFDFLEKYDASYNCFSGVNPRSIKEGTAKAVRYATALFADLDEKNFKWSKEKILTWVKRCSIPSTVTIDSGHGFHVYWFFKEPILLSDHKNYQPILKALQKVIKSDPVHDLPRIMRVPGTWNLKDPKKVVTCKVIESDYTNLYELSDFEFLLEDQETDAAKSGGTQTIPEGKRNNTLTSIAGELRNKGLEKKALYMVLMEINSNRCQPPLDKKEVASIASSVAKYPPKGSSSAKADTLRLPPESILVPTTHLTVLRFPVEVFPKLLQKFVEETAESLACPLDFVAVPMLSALGTAIGTTRKVRVKEDWLESARIWAVTVGDPGTLKSPALGKVMSPLYSLQNQFFHEHQHSVLNAEADKKDGQVFHQTLTTDSTMESLGDVLQNNPRGILYLSDEIRSWIFGMNQYKGKGTDRTNWLSLWDGRPLLVNRRNRKQPLFIPDPFVCVCGGIQPEVLADLTDERAREDGFIHRILFAFPPPTPSVWTETTVSQKTLNGYIGFIKKLWDLQPTKSSEGENTAIIAPFSDLGRRVWVEWINSHNREINDPDLSPSFRGPWKKLEAYCARFALILQEARFVSSEAPSEDIDDVSMNGAVKLVDYFKSHLKRVCPRFHATREDREVQRAIDWLYARGGSATLRDVYTAKVGGVERADDALSLLKEIVKRGLGEIKEFIPERGGLPTISIQLYTGQHSAPDPEVPEV